MDAYLYLSLIPEALVASMLPPEEFGAYLATGTRKRPHGQALFFQVDPGLRSGYFDLEGADARCAPHPDGQPKHSVYLAIYRVLEHVPPEALGGLYLVTAHGLVLEIPQGGRPPASEGAYHLYQELCPVYPLIASCLPPEELCRRITDRGEPIHVPRICFVELDLGELADDPVHGAAACLPYPHLEHVRNCLCELAPHGGKQTKTVDRFGRRSLIYRCIKGGFFVADQHHVLYYPYPTHEQLEGKYYAWWRCANDAELEHETLAV